MSLEPIENYITDQDIMLPHLDPSNPFAFSSEQMCQVVDQKHMEFLEKAGGILGIARGLHSSLKQGVDWNEVNLSFIRMFDLKQPASTQEYYNPPISKEEEHDTFIQRKLIFGSNVLPPIEEVSLLQLMWKSFQDKTLVTAPY